jgi:hypothetical protein
LYRDAVTASKINAVQLLINSEWNGAKACNVSGRDLTLIFGSDVEAELPGPPPLFRRDTEQVAWFAKQRMAVLALSGPDSIGIGEDEAAGELLAEQSGEGFGRIGGFALETGQQRFGVFVLADPGSDEREGDGRDVERGVARLLAKGNQGIGNGRVRLLGELFGPADGGWRRAAPDSEARRRVCGRRCG